MSRQIRILIACLLLLFVSCFLLALLQGPRDPELQGKRLSTWMKEYDSWMWQIKPQTQTLRQYDSSAERLLKRMLRSRDSSLEMKLLKWLSKQSLVKVQFQPASVSQYKALEMCGLLGVRVRGTVPEIEALVNDYPGRLKNPMIASFALNTLAVMGSDGTHGLVQALTNQNATIRNRAAEVLGTAPFSGTKEVVAALTKCLNAGDISLHSAASRSLTLIQQQRDQHLPAQATNWNATVEPSLKPSSSLWDIGQGIRILSESGLEQWQGSTFKAEDLFGANLSVTSTGETGSTIFQNSQPDGFTHFIEWETPTPVTVRSFGLIAVHSPPNSDFLRAFRSFKLYARSNESEQFSLVYAEDIPVPYGQGPFSCILYLFRNFESPVVARQFRAEFVQNGQGPWHGPRATELYGFGVPLNQPMIIEAVHNQETFIRDEARAVFHK